MVERGPMDQLQIRDYSSDRRLRTVLSYLQDAGMPILPGMTQPSWVKGSLSEKILGGDLTSLTVRRHLFGEKPLDSDARNVLKSLSRAIQIGNLVKLLNDREGVNVRKDHKRSQALLNLRRLGS